MAGVLAFILLILGLLAWPVNSNSLELLIRRTKEQPRSFVGESVSQSQTRSYRYVTRAHMYPSCAKSWTSEICN